jgi:signal transduction histidine kinase
VLGAASGDYRGFHAQARDTGKGIVAADMERLFGISFTRKSDGVGLTICCPTIDAHGGRLWAAQPGGPGGLIESLPIAAESGD